MIEWVGVKLMRRSGRSNKGTRSNPDKQQGRVVGYVDLRDDELVDRLCRQDILAFESLYDRYGVLVFSTSLRILGDVQVAEDIVQEVFLRLWRNPDSYHTERGSFPNWLLSVTRNRSIDELRSRSRRLRHEAAPFGSPEERPGVDERDDPALAAQVEDERDFVKQALAALPTEQRQAIELAYFRGLTQQEIAEQLRQPLGTVKTRIRLGMRKLRVNLKSQEEEHKQ